MRRAIVTTGAAAILIGAAIGPVGLATAEESAAASPARSGSQAQAANHDRVVLRRDGNRAVPFAIGALAAPRDEAFHTGDALIGAAGAFAVTVLASGAIALIRRRRPPGRLVERPRAGATA